MSESKIGINPADTLADEFAQLDLETEGVFLAQITQDCISSGNNPFSISEASQHDMAQKLAKLGFLRAVEGGVVLSDAWLTESGEKRLIKKATE
ncbi:MAG: hypothetical protein GW762_02525 [Candidatus Pacebacteria bacterium]|nr:hypothetical protein [Candidatus Paceibacterota bacterium]PIR64110.1 MAG: hypothetical protein COU64_01015 [Candidatus Pacebacteria bacterium CG10_big_fil_rev_8_21_14_0_10_40_26]PIZ78462.1 MAG: hypothetical protein COY01_04395 [Candidatus Pacebacteria bacterium CG_4_10_14_0_2_um_filter_40_20]PJA69312.1 MAG: hypothetical protein CO156_00280 [Candidatus Pacebacteria bacterium CG_4_9_14_3_um_filter_40_12]PJC41995.1 MAG: hypothetical protein CO041_01835 [Candidatus Pacebacteria bacterium CG_4_9_